MINGTGGVGVLLAGQQWIDKVSEVIRVSDRILLLKLLIGTNMVNIISVYAPQVGLTTEVKDKFFETLQTIVKDIPAGDFLLPCGDWNGHIGRETDGFAGVHGGCAHGTRNSEGERILQFAVANNLVIGNSYFQKNYHHLVTYESGASRPQIDFILCRRSHLKFIRNVKVIPGEEVTPQHKLVVADVKICSQKTRQRDLVVEHCGK